jgi:hypothetical protein
VIALASLVVALLPLAMILANLRLYRPPDPVPEAAAEPAVSLLIPARNEAGTIAPAVSAGLASRGVSLEVIVLDDHSTDDTRTIVAALARQDARVRLASAPPLPDGWTGKMHACDTLGRLACHPILVFQDADVRLSPDALARIAGFLRRERLDLASGFPRQVTRGFGERLIVPLILFVLLGFLPIATMRRRGDVGLAAGCGQLMAVDAAAWRRAGGHAAVRGSLHDGITLPRAFRRAGLRTDVFDATALATCRMYAGWSDTWAGFGKNAHEGMATWRAFPVWLALLGGGHVLPWLLLAGAAIAPSSTRDIIVAGLAALAGIAARTVLAARFRQDLVSVVLHPLGVGVLLAIQVRSLWRQITGRPTGWRGRSYAMR